jgi:Pyruvate/2-oxoacid:ferredoxin oxidoreductase delta subunit
MKRSIVEIDENLCNGCGQCVTACAEGALQLVDGKAKLVSDNYCDGLGTCLGHCPVGAIKIIEREAEAFDEKLVKKSSPCKCPGSSPRNLQRSSINNWPIQIALVPETADYFKNVDLLIAADCCAFSHLSFHQDLLQDKKLLIGCPKLDNADAYTQKLASIFKHNDINNISIVRMEVPCCRGLTQIVKAAIHISKKDIPCSESVIAIETGRVI